jgi:hypothetical protein
MLSVVPVLLGVPPAQQGLSAWLAARLALPVMQAHSTPQPEARRAPPALLGATAAAAKQIAPSASLARTTPRPEARPALPVMPARSTPRLEAARYHPAFLVSLDRTVPPLLLCSAHLALLALTAPTNVPYKDFRAMQATSVLQDHPPRPRAHQAASARRMRGPRRLAPKTRTAIRANFHPRRSVRRVLPAKSPGLERWRVPRPASRARGTCRRSSATPRKARSWWY